MKKILLAAIVIALLAFAFSGCSTPAGTYIEKADSTNDITPEDTGFTISDWYSITGDFSSSDDSDSYSVAIPSGATTMDFKVYNNGEKITGLLGISLFGFGFTAYDADGNALNYYLLQAAVNTQDLPAGTAKIIFYVYANSYFPSGDYEIQCTAY